MQLSIFTRLILSYLVLFGMLGGVSLYVIYHLDQFNGVIRSIILHDTFILEYSNRLSDALLSESRNDRKFVVLKDESLNQSYLQAKDEFNQLLREALAINTPKEIQDFFVTISSQHLHLINLVNSERELIDTAKPYSKDQYAKKKKEIADNIIENLKQIRRTSETAVFSKIVNLSENGETAKNVSLMIAGVALSVCLVVAFLRIHPAHSGASFSGSELDSGLLLQEQLG